MNITNYISKKVITMTVCVAVLVSGGVYVHNTYLLPKQVSAQKTTQEVTDMAGRTVNIAKDPKSIVSMHAVPDAIVGRLRPDLQKTVQPVTLVRIDVLSKERQEKLKSLPVVNAFYKPTSTETITAVNPDYIVTLTKDQDLNKRTAELGVPVVALKKDTIPELAESYRVMGKWLGKEQEGKEIGDYFENTAKDIKNRVEAIGKQKPRVWQASGISGETPATETIMTDILRYAGGEVYWDTHKLPASETATNEGLALPIEELIKFDPEFIFCLNDGVRKSIVSDPRLASVSAVKNNKVFTTLKYLRIDSYQGVAGARWAAGIMYPEAFEGEDIFEFASKYYKVMFGADVSSDNPLLRVLN